MKKIKIGVAGAGVFGNNHANKIKADPRAHLVGFLDHDLGRAEALANAHKDENNDCQGYDDIAGFLAQVDALVVAVPAIHHFEIAQKALAAGKHCLVEKPLSPEHSDAVALCELASKNNLVLQVGHQERYIFEAMGLLAVAESPRKLEAVRIGLPSPRGADVSATLDLMVHDIDLAALLFKSKPKYITSKRLSGKPENPDAIEAYILFENGGEASFVASRASQTRDRRMGIEYESGNVEIDFFQKTFENTSRHPLRANYLERIPDAMQAATNDFISAILGEKPVHISGDDGAKAVEIANAIDAASR
ncbi:MAG: Gfo/Idh/MocA family oxidoreductase [Pseudomonadota bacterium]